MDDDEIMTIKEVAAYLKLNEKTTTSWLLTAKYRVSKLVGHGDSEFRTYAIG